MDIDWTSAGSRLLQWPRVLLLAHDRPDGDALGALAAMHHVLAALGRSAAACLYDAIPARYRFLEAHAAFTPVSGLPADQIDCRFDGILIMDTCSWAQLEPAAAYLRSTRLPRIVLDHHATRDDLAGAGPPPVYLIDPTAASACGMLHEWCAAMNWPVPREAAIALFTGIATDTGWFRFPNTDARTLRSAAALLDAGLHADILYARLMESYSVARLRLLACTLGTLQLLADGRVALMHITPEMFSASGADPADTEDIVNEPLRSRDVIASVLVTDQGDGRIRVNLRSKSPEIVGYDVDVSKVAAGLGGGGHRRASGARVEAPLTRVIEKVAAAMSAAIQSAKTGA